jgi:DNA-binding transcriptional ArsR family regulator
LEALGELEAELPATWTVETPRDGLHFYFAAVEGITNSPGGLPKGIDVRGTGGYVIGPPSPGYKVVDRTPIAEAPDWLLDLIRTRRTPDPEPLRRERKTSSSPSKAIPNGSRNGTLFFVALALKDGGGSASEVLDALLEENRRRCEEPLEDSEVARIAASAMRYPIRSGDQSPELREAVEALIRMWWERRWKGLGGQSDRDVMRVLLELASRYGRLGADGSVEISASVRCLALAASVSYQTVSGGCTRRLEDAGLVEKRNPANPAHSATWVLTAPSRLPNTPSNPAAPALVFGSRDALPTETPTWRHRGLVAKGAAGVEALLEARGPMTRSEVAEFVGWSNASEVERRYLRRLEGLGLAEKIGDKWMLVEDHRDNVEEIKATPYAVLLRRETSETDHATGEVIHEPEVRGRSLSEDERDEETAEKHEQQRADYRALRLVVDRTDDEPVAFDELEPAPPDMLGENRVGRLLLSRGWKRFDGDTKAERRLWVNPATGEVVPIDKAVYQALEAS